jgi:hypothetical protein
MDNPEIVCPTDKIPARIGSGTQGGKVFYFGYCSDCWLRTKDCDTKEEAAKEWRLGNYSEQY